MAIDPQVPPRSGMRRVVVVMPSAFTLGNLFFGFWAMVSAYNGNYLWAGWFIIFAAVLDGLDGRIARASNSGTRFGAELDSLVDVVSFGVAPALLIYFEELSGSTGHFAWVLCFLYVVATAIRLARYNVVAAHGGRPSAWFSGLPSPGAGATLSVWYSFSHTPWYLRSFGALNAQHTWTVILMVILAGLMVSHVKYPRFPAPGFRSVNGFIGVVVYLAILIGGLTAPAYALFPIGLVYVAFGVVRGLVINLSDRADAHPESPPRERR